MESKANADVAATPRPPPTPLGVALSRLLGTSCGVTQRSLAPGEFLFHQDDPSQWLFYVVSGHVRVYLLSEDGRERTLRILSPGELAGDYAFYLRRSHSGFAQAFDGPVTTYQISRAGYETLMHRQPELYETLLRTLARTTQALTEALEHQTFQDLRERVQAVLLGIAGRHGQAGPEGVTIHMHLTHETIASIAGATRTRVSLCLSELQREGFYRVVDQRIVLSLWAAGLILPP